MNSEDGTYKDVQNGRDGKAVDVLVHFALRHLTPAQRGYIFLAQHTLLDDAVAISIAISWIELH